MEKLLVIADPIEQSPTAIEKALSLAKYSECSIHILIFCYASLTDFSDSIEGGETALKQHILNDQNKKWDELIIRFKCDTTISFEILWEKDISSFVLLHCKDKFYNLIVKTGHRSETILHTPSDWLLLRESPYPVYITTPTQPKTKKIILAAVDLLTTNEEKLKLNHKVLENAFRLAVHTNSELHLCYSIKIPKLVRELELIDVPKRTKMLEEKARLQAYKMLSEYQVEREHLHIKEGVPGEVIAQIANELQASCTVIGTLGRSGISGKIVGNTSETSLHYLKGDQLVVNP